jgi:hypothetical protein
MTDEQIAALGPAFAAELRRYRDCFRQDRTARHFDTYCRGLLSDLPRKSVEPIALAAGTAARTLQEFLVTAAWDHAGARDRLQTRLADAVAGLPPDPLGTVGVIDETSAAKKGDKTPGVQRQYLGCVGKIDNGIVTVHVGVATGRFQALLDAELYLPQSWAADRPRCRAAGIPDDVRYRSKWRIALDQLIRLRGNGVTFDWVVFDEGYGSKVPVGARVGRPEVRGRGADQLRRPEHRRRPAETGRRAPAGDADRAVAAVPDRPQDVSRPGVAGAGDTGVGGAAVARPGDGGERGDGRGEVLRHERGGRIAGANPGGGVPPGDGRARVPGGQDRGRADALRGAAVRRAGAAPDPGPGRPRVRGRPHGAVAGGKIPR